MLENQTGNIARRIPLLLVDLIQQVKRVGEHVAGTACGIADSQVFRRLDVENILVPSGIIPRRLNIVVPVLVQLTVWMGLHPKSAYRVLYQIAHDPVRCEQLGGGGNLLGSGFVVLLEPVHHLVLAFRNVVLVQPADDLHIAGRIVNAAILRSHNLHRIPQHGTLGKQIGGHKQFIHSAGLLADVFEHERQVTIPEPAFGLQQQTIRAALRIICHDGAAQQSFDALFGLIIHPQREHPAVILASFRGCKHFRQSIRAGQTGWRDHRRAGEPVHIHVTERDDAVEPSVRITFHHMPAALFTAAGTLDLMLQKSERTRVVNLGVGIRHQCGVKPCLHRIHELAARIRCEGLQFRRVHSRIFFPFSMAAISSRR